MSSSRPSLLVLAPIAPAPGGNGLAMRVWSLVNAAAAHHLVKVVVVPISGGAESPQDLPPGVTVTVLSQTDPTVSTVLSAAGAPTPDAVLSCRLGLAPLGTALARAAQIPMLIDLDEDDAQFHHARGDHAAADRWSKVAAEHLPGAALVTVSAADDVSAVEERYGLSGTVAHAPNSVHIPTEPPTGPPGEGRLLFVGNLTYAPNVEGVCWLVREVLPLLPTDLSLDLVGNPDPSVLELASTQVRVHGTVPALAPRYADADVALVPLHTGAGQRIKALEAFAHRRPVVSTTKGVEGLDVEDDVHVLLGDDPATFAAAINRARDPHVAERLVDSAHRWVVEHHDFADVVARISTLLAGPWKRDRTKPRIAPGLDVNDAGDGLVVYDAAAGRVHHLNGSAAAVFVLCTGEFDVEQIQSQIADAFGLAEAPHHEIAGCVAGLRDSGLVE